MTCDLGSCLLCFNRRTRRSEFPFLPGMKARRGVVPCEVLLFDRGEYQVTEAHFARGYRTPGSCLSPSSCLSGCSKPRSPVWVAFQSRSALRSSARPGHVGWLALPQVVTRKNRRWFELSGAIRRESELRWVVILGPKFRPLVSASGTNRYTGLLSWT